MQSLKEFGRLRGDLAHVENISEQKAQDLYAWIVGVDQPGEFLQALGYKA